MKSFSLCLALYLSIMSGLADELLADLDGLSDDGDEYNGDVHASGSSATNPLKRKGGTLGSDVEMSDGEDEGAEEEQTNEAGLVLEAGIKPADEYSAEDVQQMELGGVEDVGKIAKLENSRRMAEILKVRSFLMVTIAVLRTILSGNRKVSS
jgi:U4/U6 small nuclear ribonucleoprotein PRP31